MPTERGSSQIKVVDLARIYREIRRSGSFYSVYESYAQSSYHKAKRKSCPSKKIANFSRNYPHEVNSQYGIQVERGCGDGEVNAV